MMHLRVHHYTNLLNDYWALRKLSDGL